MDGDTEYIKASIACHWRDSRNPEDTIWETGCGELFVFEADGPAENGFKYCPYCGGPLTTTDKES